MISTAVILTRTASVHLRGRVMGVRMMIIYGLPLGLLAAGSLIDLIGYSATGTLYAASGFIVMTAIACIGARSLAGACAGDGASVTIATTLMPVCL